MAIFLTRNASNHLRNIRKSLSFHRLTHCRSSPAITVIPPSGLSQSVLPVGVLFESLAITQRCLLSTSTTSNVSSASSESTATSSESTSPSPKANSNGSEKASDSNQSGGSDGGSDGGSGGGEAGKEVRGAPVSWLSFFLLLVTGGGVVFYYDNEKKRHIEEINKNSQAVKEGPSAGQAAIGGPFNLVNHDGKNVTEKDFLGKWTVMYFGFTHCPDICPDELQKLAAAIDKIKAKAGFDLVPVFISVDPERDNVEQVGEYVKEFHPKLVGLTGTPEEIKKVARSYRVYYMKTAEEDSDYLVDHSIVMYLMSPDMKFVKFFGKNHDVDSLTDGMIKEIKQHK